ncbi:MAG TPA: sigma-70 family RNA polymerase sigma factor [Phnomibacter sp.]|nr:sigma-70 family RNA polymerase sigma factor [Phnomibacter sp.]
MANISLTDKELIQGYRNTGDNHYLGILLQRYTMLLFGVCMKYLKDEDDAKDAVQQVFQKALTELPKYEIHYFSSWLYKIAQNHCLVVLRRKKPLPAHEVDLPDEWATDVYLQQLERQQKEKLIDWVGQALEQLQEPQKQCVSLFYLQRLSYQEISEKTGYTLLQVKSAIQNGKRNIKIWVEKKCK